MSIAGAYYVYILASRRHGTFYIGVTNNLPMRLEQHWRGRGSEFVNRYGVHILVHVVRIRVGSDRAREAVEELASRLENQADRKEQLRIG
jgi:predicted GIY-YIG superfamily endonuclease